MRVFGSLFASVMFAVAVLMMTACGQSTTETTVTENGKAVPEKKSVSEDESAIETPELTKVAATTTAVQDEEWGTIKGRIIVKGDVPKPEAIDPNGKDADFCGVKEPMIPRDIVVGKDNGLKNAFLFLYMSRRDVQEPKIHPSYEKTAEDKVVVDNVNCMFEPHVAFLRTSQTLVARNSDPKGHNVQNTSRVNPFNPLIAPKGEEEIELEGPERLPTQLTCNIHPWMKAYMIVRDEPYVAISDKDGNFEIKNMPEGEWQFQFWHETCGYMSNLQKDGEPVMEGRPAIVTFNVKNGETIDLGELTISVDDLKSE